MRNLKKVLSLVLALAMMLSVMVVGAGAAFTDEDEFSAEYVTAAEVLTNIGVLKGYEDGSFQPQDTITRAETAALIYRMATGDVADAQTGIYTQMTNGFTDVPNGKWFAGYVNFCANSQYILGMGDGTFGPQKNVTGYQTLAMILRAAGFDKDGEFAGPDWEVKTASFAEKLGVLDDVKGTEDLGAPASRELVAQLLFAVMTKVELVHYAPFYGYVPVEGNETLGEKQFDLYEVEGVVWANEMANLGKNGNLALEDGKTCIKAATYDFYNLTTGLDVIGEKVTFWAVEDDAMSTPVSLADTTTEWSNTTWSTLDKDAKDAWAEACVNGKTAVYNNYEKASVGAAWDGRGVYIKCIDNNDDGIYDYVLTEKTVLTTVDNIGNDKCVTLKGFAEYDAEDVFAYSGMAEDDVVLAADFDGNLVIEKAAAFNGIVTKASVKGDEPKATIAGETYYESVLGFNVSGLTDFIVISTMGVGDDWNGTYYTFYQDAYGNIIAYEKAGENAVDYAMILDYDVYKTGAFEGTLTWRPENGINFGDLYVKYLTVDNEVEMAKVEMDTYKQYFEGGKDNVHLNDLAVGDVVKYSINENGEFFVAYGIPEDGGDITVNGKKATVGNETYKLSEDLVAFYYVAAPYGDADHDLYETLGWTVPVYGVLTGADAIADIDGKNACQIDTSANAGAIHSEPAEVLDMVNINGHIDTFVEYVYVDSFAKYDVEKINGEYVYYYDAITAAGEEVEVATFAKVPADFAAGVYEMHSLVIMGKTIDALLPLDQDMGIDDCDLHMNADGKTMDVYVIDSKTVYEEVAIPTLVDVTDAPNAGIATLDRDNCTTAIVVGDADGILAVFVTDVEDGHVYYGPDANGDHNLLP